MGPSATNTYEHVQEHIVTNGDCCFNHIIGLPEKDGIDKPLFDYERIIFDSLVTHYGNTLSHGNKHLWIKKATGLGISEFMLRFIAWLCLKDIALAGSQMCIVKGPRIDLSIVLIYSQIYDLRRVIHNYPNYVGIITKLDANNKSRSGKFIPLDKQTGLPHQCQ